MKLIEVGDVACIEERRGRKEKVINEMFDLLGMLGSQQENSTAE